METNRTILGAICGDIIGSCYERLPTKRKDFQLESRSTHFTDDTVMTVAIMAWLLGDFENPTSAMQYYGRRYPYAGYGGNFALWLSNSNPQPYNSFGNGSAMRVSPCGWIFEAEDEVMEKAKESAEVTHNHPEGIKGAQAIALAILMARKGMTKEEIKTSIETKFGYNLNQKLDDIRNFYHFDVTCQGSVPQSIIAFLESTSFEDSIRNAISLGGDADTQAAIAGSIAEAYYGGLGSSVFVDIVKRHLSQDLWNIVDRFSNMCNSLNQRILHSRTTR